MKNLDLENEKIGKLLFSFSLPCIISMLINSIYNIVDQVFIGQGVGILGNAATNVVFPLVIICNGVAGLIGNGAAANMSLRLGEKNKEDAKKGVGQAISLLFIFSILILVLGLIFLPSLLKFFGATESVYDYSYTYGKIILIGAPFMIIYTALSSIIRADGSPKYSMALLVIGAIINIILDPIFIFKFKLGVAGGAYATIIGQIVSFIIAIIYLKKMKNFKLTLKDLKIDKSSKKILGYGLASFIIQLTVLALFIVMNNVMTKYGALSKYGPDIPLSVYGIMSKVNNIYVSTVLGLAVGSQPIIGYNYGAGNYDRLKETIKKVIIVGFIIGLVFNLSILIFPKQIISLFGSSDNELYLEFAIDLFRIFLSVSMINAFEMCCSILIQSMGNVKKSTAVTFIRQIILFIPLCLILTKFIGLYGALYAAPIADTLTFIIVIFIFLSEYKKINVKNQEKENLDIKQIKTNNNIVITISREYGSGGRYVGKLLAEKLNINFYDKEIISLTAKESGLSSKYIKENEQKKESNINYELNNDDRIFIAESKVIKELSKNSCVIVGRCADYILKNNDNVVKIFLYSDDESKVNRAISYYNLSKKNALKEINKINNLREKHYEYYTNRKWKELSNYDMMINVDKLGIEKTVEFIYELLSK